MPIQERPSKRWEQCKPSPPTATAHSEELSEATVRSPPGFGILIEISNKLRQLRLTYSSSLLKLQEEQGQTGTWGLKLLRLPARPSSLLGTPQSPPVSSTGLEEVFNFQGVTAMGANPLNAPDVPRAARGGSDAPCPKRLRGQRQAPREQGCATRLRGPRARALTRYHRDKRAYYQPILKHNYETTHLQQRFSQRSVLADEPALKYKLH